MATRALPNLGALRIVAGARSDARGASTGAPLDWRNELEKNKIDPFTQLEEWAFNLKAVSYTHLTLPTNSLV